MRSFNIGHFSFANEDQRPRRPIILTSGEDNNDVTATASIVAFVFVAVRFPGFLSRSLRLSDAGSSSMRRGSRLSTRASEARTQHPSALKSKPGKPFRSTPATLSLNHHAVKPAKPELLHRTLDILQPETKTRQKVSSLPLSL